MQNQFPKIQLHDIVKLKNNRMCLVVKSDDYSLDYSNNVFTAIYKNDQMCSFNQKAQDSRHTEKEVGEYTVMEVYKPTMAAIVSLTTRFGDYNDEDDLELLWEHPAVQEMKETQLRIIQLKKELEAEEAKLSSL